MDFKHSEERQMLSDSIGRYLQNEYLLPDRNAAASSELGFDQDKWAQFAELGVVGALFSEEMGGFGGKGFDLAVIFEALGRGLVVEPLLDCALLPGFILALAGDKERVGSIIDGAARYALAVEEDESHFDLAWVATTAHSDGNDFLLSGKKAAVKFAEGSNGVIVSARTAGNVSDDHGISIFLLPADTPGVSMRGYNTIDGGRAAVVSLRDVRLPPEALIGEAGAGYALLKAARDRGLLAVSAEALGAMEQVKDMTLEYLRNRKQFGTVIGHFQALQHRMAQLLIEIEQARSAVINAASAIDSNAGDLDKVLAAAKYTIGQVGAKVAEESIQLHGGIGMTWEYDLAHYAKRLIMIDHEFGDEDYHLSRYVELSRGSYSNQPSGKV